MRLPVDGRQVDAVMLEVVQNALRPLVDEMDLIVMRTAYSGIVCDPSAGVVNGQIALEVCRATGVRAGEVSRR